MRYWTTCVKSWCNCFLRKVQARKRRKWVWFRIQISSQSYSIRHALPASLPCSFPPPMLLTFLLILRSHSWVPILSLFFSIISIHCPSNPNSKFCFGFPLFPTLSSYKFNFCRSTEGYTINGRVKIPSMFLLFSEICWQFIIRIRILRTCFMWGYIFKSDSFYGYFFSAL